MIILATLGILLSLSNASAQADKTVDVGPTRLEIYNPGAPKALLLAPGSGCNPRLDMYNAIGDEARRQNFTFVRLYWSYCLVEPNGTGSDEMVKRDFREAFTHVRSTLGYAEADIFVGGKSLGSIVSAEFFGRNPALPGLVLLTPVCTETSGNVFAEAYPNLANETRLVLAAQGDSDGICEHVHFSEYLKNKGQNFVPLTVKGDHAFGSGTPSSRDRNLKVIANWLFTWLR